MTFVLSLAWVTSASMALGCSRPLDASGKSDRVLEWKGAQRVGTERSRSNPMTLVLTPEEQRSLVARVRDGEPAAEDALVRLFGERVRRMMRVRTQDAEAARDLAQEVMIVVWRAIREGHLRDPERLAAFVYSTARNLAREHLRQQERHASLESRGDLRLAAASDPVEDDERRKVLQRAIARLSRVDRRILLLTLVHGLTPKEVGRSVGMNPELVRTRKSRALKKVTEMVRQMTRTP